jgi:hypothetical protein
LAICLTGIEDVAAGRDWDKPILGQRKKTAVNPPKPERRPGIETPPPAIKTAAKREAGAKPRGRFWVGLLTGLVFGAGACGAAGLFWLNGVAGLGPGKPGTTAANGPAAAARLAPTSISADAGVAIDTYAALMRVAQSDASDATVEAMFQRYIVTSNALASASTDQWAKETAALGTGPSGSIDLLYLQPLKLAALHMDECAARVVAARLANPADPTVKAQTATLTLALCRGRGPLDGLGSEGLGGLVRRCIVAVEASLKAARKGRLNIDGLEVAAGLATSQQPAVCPPASNFIRATLTGAAKANP